MRGVTRGGGARAHLLCWCAGRHRGVDGDCAAANSARVGSIKRRCALALEPTASASKRDEVENFMVQLLE